MEERLGALLAQRTSLGLLRQLTLAGDDMADFSSNDYLGLARSRDLAAHVDRAWASEHGHAPVLGSTGSRLLTGNSTVAEQLEQQLATFHQAQAALLFNSGYDANVGFFASVPQRGDQVFYDELIHASVHDGMRMGRAERSPFKHNNVEHLAGLLAARRPVAHKNGAPSNVIVVVESVYSMDGDEAPLRELAALCQRTGASLVVDEAHSTGLYGPNGVGAVQALGLQDHVFARLHTFGKAVGCHGAAILGSHVLRSFLINYARSVIYTTSLPAHSLVAVSVAYRFMADADDRRQHLRMLIDLFRRCLKQLPAHCLLPSSSPIQGVVIPGNEQVVKLATALRTANFDVKPIRSPTVPAGTERVRICLHAHNTVAQVSSLCAAIVAFFDASSLHSIPVVQSAL